MKLSLKIEQLAILLAAIALFNTLSFPWWWYLLFFLSPDIGMFGYLANPKVGAITYNLFHHQGIAILFILGGYYIQNEILLFVGSILLGHSSFDRILGYGLKFYKGFKSTHLGDLG